MSAGEYEDDILNCVLPCRTFGSTLATYFAGCRGSSRLVARTDGSRTERLGLLAALVLVMAVSATSAQSRATQPALDEPKIVKSMRVEGSKVDLEWLNEQLIAASAGVARLSEHSIVVSNPVAIAPTWEAEHRNLVELLRGIDPNCPSYKLDLSLAIEQSRKSEVILGGNFADYLSKLDSRLTKYASELGREVCPGVIRLRHDEEDVVLDRCLGCKSLQLLPLTDCTSPLEQTIDPDDFRGLKSRLDAAVESRWERGRYCKTDRVHAELLRSIKEYLWVQTLVQLLTHALEENLQVRVTGNRYPAVDPYSFCHVRAEWKAGDVTGVRVFRAAGDDVCFNEKLPRNSRALALSFAGGLAQWGFKLVIGKSGNFLEGSTASVDLDAFFRSEGPQACDPPCVN